MKITDIPHLRLQNQQITNPQFKDPQELLKWMGAMQAQDFPMARLAIGIRFQGATEKQVQAAIDKGEILRTHVMRPTWHFVAAEDIHWMLQLTASHIRSSMRSRHKQLEITDAVLSKSNKLLEKALRDGAHLTREELLRGFEKAKIATGDNRLSHLLFCAELEGLICSGASRGKDHTYALLEMRVAANGKFNREEALAKLARKYFQSHGPATLQDFTWWSGLPVPAARQALESVKGELFSETIASQTFWFMEFKSVAGKQADKAFLLPAYDEFVISYKDRSAVLSVEEHSRSVSSNGIFRPVIVLKGKIVGLWKRSVVKNKLLIETEFFKPPSKTALKLIEKAAEELEKYYGKKAEIAFA